MKTIKIIIVAVLLAVIGFVVYLISNSTPPTTTTDGNGGGGIPIGCEYIKKDSAYIDSVFKAIPNGDFEKLNGVNQTRMAEYDSLMEKDMVDCREAMQMLIHSLYRNRFVEMADNEFNGREWQHFKNLYATNTTLLNMEPESPRLKRIDKICKEYNAILVFNGRVWNQCQQKPKSTDSEWNAANTRNILSSIPSASEPVSHTSAYANARQAREKLYSSHVVFLDSLIVLTKNNMPDNISDIEKLKAFKHVKGEVDVLKKMCPLYGKEFNKDVWDNKTK